MNEKYIIKKKTITNNVELSLMKMENTSYTTTMNNSDFEISSNLIYS